MDILWIIPNTYSMLSVNISNYPRLRNVPIETLKKYHQIGNGTGIHWPGLDEDLSLKGFLRDTTKA